MKLKEFVSCYQTKTYACDRVSFKQVVSAFQKQAKMARKPWKKIIKSDDKVLFKQGCPVGLTFNYSGDHLEIQAIFEFDEKRQQMTLSVGNWGFPPEPLLSKRRYIKKLGEISHFVEQTQLTS